MATQTMSVASQLDAPRCGQFAVGFVGPPGSGPELSRTLPISKSLIVALPRSRRSARPRSLLAANPQRFTGRPNKAHSQIHIARVSRVCSRAGMVWLDNAIHRWAHGRNQHAERELP